MIAALASLGGVLKSRDGMILTLGFVLVAGSLVYNAGDRHGSQRAAVEQAKAIVKITEEGEKAQSSLDKKVTGLEARAKVRRAQSEKKATDAVAHIQANEPQVDPVLVWADAIDGLRDDRGASVTTPTHSRSLGGDSGTVPTSGAASANSWAI